MNDTKTALLQARREKAARERARNRIFVRAINAVTVCAYCGDQPIEWHNPEHATIPGRDRYRISKMVQGPRSIAAITTEMDRCTPLCHRCHIIEDGRLSHWHAMVREPKPRSEPKPCIACGKTAKPLRRGLCNRCDWRQRYHRQTQTGENAGAVTRREWARRRRGAA